MVSPTDFKTLLYSTPVHGRVRLFFAEWFYESFVISKSFDSSSKWLFLTCGLLVKIGNRKLATFPKLTFSTFFYPVQEVRPVNVSRKTIHNYSNAVNNALHNLHNLQCCTKTIRKHLCRGLLEIVIL